MEKSIEITTTNNDTIGNTPELNLAANFVADVMTTNLVTLSPHQTFAEAVHIMSNSPFRHYLVTYSDGRLAGVFSDRDILRALGQTSNWQAKRIDGVMTRNIVTVNPTTALSVAATEMLTRRINCLPVVGDEGKVCGIITSTDLLRRYQKIQARLETHPDTTEW